MIKIKFSEQELKRYVDKGGDLVLEFDVPVSDLPDWPQANEVALPSGRDKRWEDDPNYNDYFCLIDKIRATYVLGCRYSLKRAQYDALRAVYDSPNHELNYIDFVRAYDQTNPERDKRKPSEFNSKASAICNHNNKMFKKRGVPIRLVRKNGNVCVLISND